MTSLFEPRAYFKPLEYPWAHQIWREHESVHWLGYEVPMHEDVRDWNSRLTESERNLLTHLFRFFTQADVDVAGGYNNLFIPMFSHKPELAMMMDSFAAREAIHIDAYALLLETVGMPEVTYQQFQDYKEMKDKHDFVAGFDTSNPKELAKALAVYSAFTEGMQLFASFVVLLNFDRFGKMKNMANIVAWSIRDESMHVEGMTQLFKELIKEHPVEGLEAEIEGIARKMVELEDAFIDLIFSDSTAIEGLTAQEVKDYIRFIANKRWNGEVGGLGFEGVLYPDNTTNPLPWVDFMVNGEEHANFFERKGTAYAKASTQGSMEEIEW